MMPLGTFLLALLLLVVVGWQAALGFLVLAALVWYGGHAWLRKMGG